MISESSTYKNLYENCTQEVELHFLFCHSFEIQYVINQLYIIKIVCMFHFEAEHVFLHDTENFKLSETKRTNKNVLII